MVVLYKVDRIVPGLSVECLVQVLKVQYESPRLFVPGVFIFDFFGHGDLIGWKVLVADDVVKVGGKGYFEERFEDGVSIVGEAPQVLLGL